MTPRRKTKNTSLWIFSRPAQTDSFEHLWTLLHIRAQLYLIGYRWRWHPSCSGFRGARHRREKTPDSQEALRPQRLQRSSLERRKRRLLRSVFCHLLWITHVSSCFFSSFPVDHVPFSHTLSDMRRGTPRRGTKLVEPRWARLGTLSGREGRGREGRGLSLRRVRRGFFPLKSSSVHGSSVAGSPTGALGGVGQGPGRVGGEGPRGARMPPCPTLSPIPPSPPSTPPGERNPSSPVRHGISLRGA